ncbi:2-phospho-L-lactate guanylyltransferase [Actinomycetospora atypica]|uniref:Phosphoenolpyruvate guanylyltransferase n=1 Tax=Actinomycetospora atypica TaxID=1290095 RepID=A0ABV9YF82_9PSEU
MAGGPTVRVSDLVVPVKELRLAKTRLAPASAAAADPDDPAVLHARLALALAADTLAAVLASGVARVAVVTPDPRVAGLAPDGTTARPLPVADPGRGLNAAIRAGIDALAGDAPVAALLADLPALRPAALDDALRAAGRALRDAPAAFVADHTGTGTALLVLRRDFTPRFGPGSAAAHRAAGAVALDGDWPGLRHDVDTPADLAEVRALGVGPATLAWPAVPAVAAGSR